MNNTAQSQYVMFKGARPNARNFKPFAPSSGQSFEVWAALNDVNILSLTNQSVTFEYAFIADMKKKWAKLSGSFTDTAQEQVEQDIAAKVEAIRNEIDEVGK